MTREQGKHVRIGDRVVYKASGSTGEVRVVIPDWGVEVWVFGHHNARERWWWDSITVRNPRKIKRYPRPFRFARLNPTKCCHCPEGVMVAILRKNKKTIHRKAINRKMKVLGENKVQCNLCKNLVGSESFPQRIIRAAAMLKRAEEDGTLPRPRNKKASFKKKRRISPTRNRPKKRSTNTRVQGGLKKKASKKSPRNLVLRPRRRKEKGNGFEKEEIVSKVIVPTEQSPTIPTPESTAVPETPKENLT